MIPLDVTVAAVTRNALHELAQPPETPQFVILWAQRLRALADIAEAIAHRDLALLEQEAELRQQKLRQLGIE